MNDKTILLMFVVVQSLSHLWLFNLMDLIHQAPQSPRVCSNSCPLRWWCCLTTHLLLSPPLLPSILCNISVFSSESALCIKWPKYWSFSISPSNEYSGLISFWFDWFDLLAVHRTLQNLLQHYSLKTSILWWPTFFMVQISHP